MNRPAAAVSMPTVPLLLRWCAFFTGSIPETEVQHRPGLPLAFLVRESLGITSADVLAWGVDLDKVMP